MTEKRFKETISTGIVTDTVTGKEYNCEYRVSNDFIELINQLAEENEELKGEVAHYKLILMFLEQEAKRISKIR